jgi:DNA gyrase subunit A
VQRRILFSMWQKNLTADAKHRKCATVVGDVMGWLSSARRRGALRSARPHGAVVSLRYPLVDGSGNFGSLDGDSAAAMRYTECRLARIATRCSARSIRTPCRSAELRRHEDRAGRAAGAHSQPAVNGATGIAVGMATNIPPHNLGEVCTALLKLLDNPTEQRAVVPLRQGPDFPDRRPDPQLADELKEIYKTGSGRSACAHLGEGAETRGRRRSTSPASRTR